MPKYCVSLCLALAIATPASASPLETFKLQVAGLPAGFSVAEKTEQEAIAHSHQLQLHQGFALATLGAMALTTGLGVYTSNFAAAEHYGTLRSAHMGLGGLTTGLYLGAATLALTAPKGYEVTGDGWDSVTIHRSLGWVHAATLATTLALGILASTGKFDKLVHGIAGGTTLGLMAISAGVIALDF